MRWIMLVAMICWGAAAAAWEEPARGTATRAALMNAIRPHAEWNLGAPVQFVVHDQRRQGNVAYGSLYAQRPGGGVIDQSRTPMMRRGEADDFMDVASVQVLYRKAGDTWVAVHFAFGAGDVWFAWEPLCCQYHAVIADFCVGMT